MCIRDRAKSVLGKRAVIDLRFQIAVLGDRDQDDRERIAGDTRPNHRRTGHRIDDDRLSLAIGAGDGEHVGVPRRPEVVEVAIQAFFAARLVDGCFPKQGEAAELAVGTDQHPEVAVLDLAHGKQRTSPKVAEEFADCGVGLGHMSRPRRKSRDGDDQQRKKRAHRTLSLIHI